MKHSFLQIAAAASILVALSSCDSKSKLAEDVTGTWTTEQITIANDAQGQTVGNDIFAFQRTDQTATGGTVSLASTLSLTRGADALAPADAPVSVSIAATAAISGKWQAIDDDEITITFDPNTLKISVDPDAIALTANPLNGNTPANIDSIKPAVAQFYQTELTNTMRQHYASYSRLDDVKLKDNGSTLKIEIKDSEMLLHRM